LQQEERDTYHRKVIAAIEACIVAFKLAQKPWYTPATIAQLDAAMGTMLATTQDVFTPVSSVGEERRPKAHMVGAHLVRSTMLNGASINFSTNASEGRNRSDIKAAYALTNHGGSVHAQMMKLVSLKRFIEGPFSLLARMPPPSDASGVPVTAADVLEGVDVYRTVPFGFTQSRRPIPPDLLDFAKRCYSVWLARELGVDSVQRAIYVSAADTFNAAKCWCKPRARLIKLPLASTHIVADRDHKWVGGNSMARERVRGRHDFVEVFDGGGNPNNNSIVRLELILTYQFDSERVGEFVLLRKLTPQLPSPFTLLDFHRELPANSHNSYSWLPLNTILRPIFVLPNYKRKLPGQKFGERDGWLVVGKLQ
jgi:hypothetical protein